MDPTNIKGIKKLALKYPHGATSNAYVVDVVDYFEQQLREVTAAADRLTDNVVQLQREKKRLMDEVDALSSPVVLPREVAEAIDFYRQRDTRDWEIYDCGIYGEVERQALAIREWLCTDGERNLLMRALVIGYTIEEPTTEDKLRQRFSEQLNHYETRAGIDNDVLAAVLAMEVREVLAEEQNQESTNRTG